jgi:hypothetical protein
VTPPIWKVGRDRARRRRWDSHISWPREAPGVGSLDANIDTSADMM